jgi:hypothetical protein
MRIYISNRIYNELQKFKHEDCGIICGRKYLNKLFPFKNVSKKEYTFAVKRIELLKHFIFHPFEKRFCLYHIHKHNGKPSEIDFKNMLEDIIYLIVYQTSLFFYVKQNKEVKLLEYKII